MTDLRAKYFVVPYEPRQDEEKTDEISKPITDVAISANETRPNRLKLSIPLYLRIKSLSIGSLGPLINLHNVSLLCPLAIAFPNGTSCDHAHDVTSVCFYIVPR